LIFVKAVSQILAVKAHLKLNNRRIYSADEQCVGELLKVCNLVYECTVKASVLISNDNMTKGHTLNQGAIIHKLDQLKSYRSLASEITEKGVNLFDAMTKEVDYRDIRSMALAKQVDLPAIKKEIDHLNIALESQTKLVQLKVEQSKADEQNLATKIEKKKTEIERCEKRLKSLQGVR
jgi:hypothetical protein